jgi:NAD(P)-dependent dehydrogenase (short-subunit alcohol dehydrogenase family)
LATTDVDYKGVVYGTQLAIHFMRKNPTPGGHIVCTVSAAALYPHETYPEYDGAKAAVCNGISAVAEWFLTFLNSKVLNFTRATSRVLGQKENIHIGAVLPGIVRTNIIPPEMVAAVSPECMTPVSTIVSAYQKLIDSTNMDGEAIECSADNHFIVPRPEYLNGTVSKRACTVWEPLFKHYHGEDSGLPDAIA